MSVRHFIEADLGAVCRIYLDAKRDELKFEPGCFEITPLDRDAVILANFKESDVLVFEEDDVLGFSATFDGQLRALFVHGDARGKGVGSTLLKVVLADSAGCLSLNVAKSNVAAKRFYESNGFATVGETVRQYSGNDVLYSRMVHAPTHGAPQSTPLPSI